MAQVQIDMPDDVQELITNAVDSGDFANDSEMVSVAVRRLAADRAVDALGVEYLRRKWDEAIAAGGEHDADEVMDRLERKYAALAESDE